MRLQQFLPLIGGQLQPLICEEASKPCDSDKDCRQNGNYLNLTENHL